MVLVASLVRRDSNGASIKQHLAFPDLLDLPNHFALLRRIHQIVDTRRKIITGLEARLFVAGQDQAIMKIAHEVLIRSADTTSGAGLPSRVSTSCVSTGALRNRFVNGRTGVIKTEAVEV